LKITFLGTGTSGGVPMIGCTCAVCQSEDPRDKRLRSSVLVEGDRGTVAIDCGPDFRQQMLTHDVVGLDAIVFTHEHRDHTGGLDNVRAFNFIQRRPMALHARPRVFEALKRHYDYAFHSNYPGVPVLDLHEIGEEPFEVAGMNFEPIEVLHYRMPVLGFRIGGFVYITDASVIPEDQKDRIAGCDILVLNALRREKHISHFTLEEAISMVRELKPGKAYFTHVSHQLGLYREVAEELPEDIQLAYDGLSLYF
jgi:phosphoribosyl 1,2-cyclic phosphate phosphodiesterase